MLLIKALFLLALKVKVQDVFFEIEDGLFKSVRITLRHYKTNTNNTPLKLVICKWASKESENCQVNI